MDWFRAWLDVVAPPGRPVVLVGFSGGAAFAGGLLLDDPARYAGTALLYGTLPFDAGLATTPGRLTGAAVFLAHGEHDTVIPPDLLERTWTYLRHGSGATLRARRDPVGHAIAGAALAELSGWLIDRIGATPARPAGGPDRSASAGPARSGGDQ